MGTLRAMLIGTSGWQYRHWRGGLYPEGLAVSALARPLSERFATVEVNNAFYRLARTGYVQDVVRGGGGRLRFRRKASRYLTHVRRLRDPDEPVQRFLERASGLGPKLGPVLVQLPPEPERRPGRFGPGAGLLPAGGAGGRRVPPRQLVDARGPARCWSAMGRRCAWPTRRGNARPFGARRTGVTCACMGAGPAAGLLWASRAADMGRRTGRAVAPTGRPVRLFQQRPAWLRPSRRPVAGRGGATRRLSPQPGPGRLGNPPALVKSRGQGRPVPRSCPMVGF